MTRLCRASFDTFERAFSRAFAFAQAARMSWEAWIAVEFRR